MACVKIPIPTIPTLGLGLSLAPPALPPLSLDANICCKLFDVSIPSIPLPIDPILIAAALPALDGVLAAIQEYIDLLPLDCPLE